MKIIAFTGMPFSGKTEAIRIINKKNISIIRMGDIVWDEVKKRGLKLTDKNVGFVANQMREEFGNNIWAIKTIEKIKLKYKTSLIIIDGVRSCDEVDIFKKTLGTNFILIGITSSDDLRYKRALIRGRKDDSKILNNIKERDKREIAWGIKDVIKLADIIVLNDGSIEDLGINIIEIINNL